MAYKIGAKFMHISDNALVKDAIFTIGKCVDPETEYIPNTERTKEKELFGIALLNPDGLNYSRIIHKGNCDNINEVSDEEFIVMTANTHLDFKFIG